MPEERPISLFCYPLKARGRCVTYPLLQSFNDCDDPLLDEGGFILALLPLDNKRSSVLRNAESCFCCNRKHRLLGQARLPCYSQLSRGVGCGGHLSREQCSITRYHGMPHQSTPPNLEMLPEQCLPECVQPGSS